MINQILTNQKKKKLFTNIKNFSSTFCCTTIGVDIVLAMIKLMEEWNVAECREYI